MSQIHPVPARVSEGAAGPVTSLDQWREVRGRSGDDPNGFWLEQATSRIAWDIGYGARCVVDSAMTAMLFSQ